MNEPIRPTNVPRKGGIYETTDEAPVFGPMAEATLLREILAELKTLNQTFSGFGNFENERAKAVRSGQESDRREQEKHEPIRPNPEHEVPGSEESYPHMPNGGRSPKTYSPYVPDEPTKSEKTPIKDRHARPTADPKRR